MKMAASKRKRVPAQGIPTSKAAAVRPVKKQKRNPEEVVKQKEEFRRFLRTFSSTTSPPSNNTASTCGIPPVEAAKTSTMLHQEDDSSDYSDWGILDTEDLLTPRSSVFSARSDTWSEARSMESPPERECSACADVLLLQNFPRLPGCDHDPDVCLECFLQWLNQQMMNVESVLCPSNRCSYAVTHEDVWKHAPRDVFTRFEELSVECFLSANKDFIYCLAEGCPSGQIHDTGVEGPIVRCAACGYRMCTAHRPVIPFHEGEACTQYTERLDRERAEREARDQEVHVRREQEEASAAEVGRSSVECPGCGVQIQKTSGCDHMTCRRRGCAFQFCYVCRAPYLGEQGINKIGNGAHTESCSYHSKKLLAYQGTV